MRAPGELVQLRRPLSLIPALTTEHVLRVVLPIDWKVYRRVAVVVDPGGGQGHVVLWGNQIRKQRR